MNWHPTEVAADSSLVLNVLASRSAGRILGCAGVRLIVSACTLKETPDTETDEMKFLLGTGYVQEVDITGDTATIFRDAACELDDAAATAIALCLVRRIAIGTEDGCVLKVLRQYDASKGIVAVGIIDVLRSAAAQLPEADLRNIISSVRTGAPFRTQKTHDRWWFESLGMQL